MHVRWCYFWKSGTCRYFSCTVGRHFGARNIAREVLQRFLLLEVATKVESNSKRLQWLLKRKHCETCSLKVLEYARHIFVQRAQLSCQISCRYVVSTPWCLQLMFSSIRLRFLQFCPVKSFKILVAAEFVQMKILNMKKMSDYKGIFFFAV